MTGPGYAASTFTSTPKSDSFFSIRREVNSSVSGLIPSRSPGGSSRSVSGGSGVSGRSSNSGTCFSLLTRSDFGISSDRRLDADRLVLLDPLLLRLDQELALARARSPNFRSCAPLPQLDRARTRPTRAAAPMRSMTASHEMPDEQRQADRRHREKQQRRAGEAEGRVEDLADARRRATRPARAAGSRGANESAGPRAPDVATSTIENPASAMMNGRRSEIELPSSRR